MLKKLERQDFDRYVEFAYRLALDTTKSGYPTYADGIKTKEDFISSARSAFSQKGEEILLYERDGVVCGWIHYFFIPEDHYLQLRAFCISEGMEDAMAEFIAYVREKFPGSELYLGFPKENQEAVAFLDGHGFPRIEESYPDVLHFCDYTLHPESREVIPVTRENYPLFAALHSQIEGEMYWNSERILQAMDRWKIYLLMRGGKAAGAIYCMTEDDKVSSEIFGVDFPHGVYNGETFRDLLTVALNHEKRRGVGHMVFFNDAETQADALACGFHCVGEYVCFLVKL